MNEKNTNQKQNYMELAIEEIEIDEELCIRAKEGQIHPDDNEEEINESLKMYGPMNPIKVTFDVNTKKYKLLDGYKRWDAMRQKNPASKIPAYVINQSPRLAYYTLNEIRQKFTVMEKAEAIQNVLKEFKPEDLPDNEAAKRIPISPQGLADYKKIASLPEPLRNKVRHLKKCTVHQLRRIAGIENPLEQEKALSDYINAIYPKQIKPEVSKPSYAKIDQNRIAKFKDTFGKKAEKWEVEEARQILKDIEELIDFLQDEKQRLKENIAYKEAIDKAVEQALNSELISDSEKEALNEEAKEKINDLLKKKSMDQLPPVPSPPSSPAPRISE